MPASKTKRAGRLVNRSELGELLGVSLPTVDAWVKKGLPVVTRGNRSTQWEFDTASVYEWGNVQAALDTIGDVTELSKSEAERRLAAANAGLAELKLSQARGECASIEDIAEVWRDIVTNMRARLLPMGGKLAPLIQPLKKRTEIKELIDANVSEALDELSRYG